MTDTHEVLLVQTTFPADRADECLHAMRTLVEERLVGCAQVLATEIHSVFRWEGEQQQEQEILVLLKTCEARWEALQERLVELHPYEVPEMVACPARASQAYGAWLHRQCRPAAS